MYYPYFRGKQYDLITIRECADLIAGAGFTPIIEPVREGFNGLVRTVAALSEADAGFVLIANPANGDHQSSSDAIDSLIVGDLKDAKNLRVGILLTEETELDEAQRLIGLHAKRPLTLIHTGFSHAKALADHLAALSFAGEGNDICHVFQEEQCGKLYRRHFENAPRILLRDGFQRRVNRQHPPLEFFSDLHVTFREENMDGFGDYLIVGNDYSESGGPAYAVAIHLTYIDQSKDQEMWVHHFKSERQDSPSDPGGKFLEALTKLVAEVNRPGSQVRKTGAVQEFLELYNRAHFPGLGYVKKLSMKHHLETLALHFKEQE